MIHYGILVFCDLDFSCISHSCYTKTVYDHMDTIRNLRIFSMIDTQKVRLMTKVASYEKSVGSREIKMSHYNKSEYLALKVLDTFVSTSIIILGAEMLYAAYVVMSAIEKQLRPDYMQLFRQGGIVYVFVILFALLCGLVHYAKVYENMRKNIKAYDEYLKELQTFYLKEEKYSFQGEAYFPDSMEED